MCAIRLICLQVLLKITLLFEISAFRFPNVLYVLPLSLQGAYGRPIRDTFIAVIDVVCVLLINSENLQGMILNVIILTSQFEKQTFTF